MIEGKLGRRRGEFGERERDGWSATMEERRRRRRRTKYYRIV